MTQASGKKISQFIGITELSDSDYVTLISAGVNYKMLVSDFRAGLGVPGSPSVGLINMQNNAVSTEIVTQDVPVLVAGTWSSSMVNGFSATAAGRLTYTLSGSRVFNIDVETSLSPDSGNASCGILIAKNGAQIDGSLMWAHVNQNDESEVSTCWSVSLSQDDYIEIMVVNLSGTSDILVDSAILRVS